MGILSCPAEELVLPDITQVTEQLSYIRCSVLCPAEV